MDPYISLMISSRYTMYLIQWVLMLHAGVCASGVSCGWGTCLAV